MCYLMKRWPTWSYPPRRKKSLTPENSNFEIRARSGIKENLYIRPLAYKSSESLGVRLHNLDDDFLAFVIPWGPYLDTDVCRVGVSSWRRPEPLRKGRAV